MKKILVLFFILSISILGQTIDSLIIDEAPGSIEIKKYHDVGDGFLVAGFHDVWSSHDPGDFIHVTKFDYNGVQDIEFGVNGNIYFVSDIGGIRLLDFTYQDDTLTFLIEYQTQNPKLALIKIDSEGNLAENFGDGGVKILMSLSDDNINSYGYQLNAGEFIYFFHDESTKNSFIYKFKSDGSIDNNFGADGIVELKFVQYDTIFNYMTIHDNLMYLFGYSQLNPRISILRMLPDGSIDDSFANSGQANIPLTGQYKTKCIAASLNDNTISMLCEEDHFVDEVYLITKCDYDGNVINSFGDSGKLSLPELPDFFDYFDLLALNNGDIFVFYTEPEDYNRFAKIYKYDSSGELISSFGEGGIKTLDSENYYVTLFQIAIHEETLLLFKRTGYSNEISNVNYSFEPIQNFGASGTASYEVDRGSENIFTLNMGIENKLIVGTYGSSGWVKSLQLKKINSNFAFDNNYGINVGNEEFNTYQITWNNLKEVSADHSYLYGFVRDDIGYMYPNLQKLDQFGKIDTNFKLHGDFPSELEITNLFQLSNGDFLAHFETHQGKELIGKITSEGAIDSSFGNSGFSPEINNSYMSNNVKLQVDEDGKIYVHRTEYIYPFVYSNEVIRLKSDGFLDTSFAINGIPDLYNHSYGLLDLHFVNDKIRVLGENGDD